jgi:diguanylate cyclase (GGDEF)-like protein
LAAFSRKRTVSEIVQSFRKGMAEEDIADLWDDETDRVVQGIYKGLLTCVEDELYLQEFLPFGSLYKLAGQHGVLRRTSNIPIEKVMQEHILLRDVFWEYKRAQPSREHDFVVEKRICQCFNSLMQATVQAYQTKEPTMDALRPLRDEVTGIFGNDYFMTRLEEELKRAERYLRKLTVVIFRMKYDFAGGSHEENEMMRAVARVLRRNSRASDILGRISKAEFAMMLPETPYAEGEKAGERLKNLLLEYLVGMGSDYAGVGISLGIAAYPEHGDEAEVLMEETAQSILRTEAAGS